MGLGHHVGEQRRGEERSHRIGCLIGLRSEGGSHYIQKKSKNYISVGESLLKTRLHVALVKISSRPGSASSESKTAKLDGWKHQLNHDQEYGPTTVRSYHI